MPTDKQRREAARRHLERQLQRRAEKAAARKRFTLVASIGGTLVVIAVVVVAILMVGGNSGSPSATGVSGSPGATDTSGAQPTPTPAPSQSYPPATGQSVTFDKVTVSGATDMNGYPTVTSAGTGEPAKLLTDDLVTGTGPAAAPGNLVTVQYVGVFYQDGTPFDSSWEHGAPVQFPVKSGPPDGTIEGFATGIGGGTGIDPMKVGGRRLIIIPSAQAYGDQANGPIPANTPLVFVVDLISIDS